MNESGRSVGEALRFYKLKMDALTVFHDELDCNQDGLPDECDPTYCVADLAPPFGVLNVFDFLAFQTAFGSGDPCADLAPPFGVLNVFDFLAFQTAFGSGC